MEGFGPRLTTGHSAGTRRAREDEVHVLLNHHT